MLQLVGDAASPNLMPFLAVCLVALTVGLIAIVAVIANLRKLREQELMASVVHSMVEAGFSPADVERVLKTAGMRKKPVAVVQNAVEAATPAHSTV